MVKTMRKFFEKLPYPITGLMLGLAALGNLLGSYNQTLRSLLGIISAVIGISIIIKVILLPKSLKLAFDNPVVASVMGTFPMGLIILSTYLKPIHANSGLVLWWVGLGLHGLLIIIFTLKYIINFNIKKVFPSYFIVYVGIVCASVTAPAFALQALGQKIFWFGLISYLILLPIVIHRILVVKEMPKPSLPTLIIMAAPASLCLAGYFKSFESKQMIIVHLLGVIAIGMAIYALINLPKLLRLPFMPSYSAFTFPFVITGIALTGYSNIVPQITILGYLFTVLASIMVLYVLIRYTLFMISNRPLDKQAKKVS